MCEVSCEYQLVTRGRGSIALWFESAAAFTPLQGFAHLMTSKAQGTAVRVPVSQRMKLRCRGAVCWNTFWCGTQKSDARTTSGASRVDGLIIFTLQPSLLGFTDHSDGKDSTCNAGDPSSIPGSGRSHGEGTGCPFQYSWASLVAQIVKNLPAMQKTWVQSMGWEDPLEEGMVTHSSITVSNVRSKLTKTTIKLFWWLPVRPLCLEP